MKEDSEGIDKIGSVWGDDTVGEVGELHRSVDEGEAQGDGGVDAAGDKAVDCELVKHRVPFRAILARPFRSLWRIDMTFGLSFLQT